MASSNFFAKIYNRDGSTYKRVIDSSLFLNRPRIVREVGMPASDVTIDLALAWDDFGFNTTIVEGYLVKIYAQVDGQPDAFLVYQGHITEIVATLSGSVNHVRLRLFPIDALLGFAFWKSGGGDTLADYTVTYSGADIDTIFEDVIDDVNTIHGTFFDVDLDSPALSVDLEFVQLNHLTAMRQAATFLDADWYWYIDADGLVHLTEYLATATHWFVVGKHTDSVEVTSSILDLANGIRLQYDGGYSFYSDATSESAYNKKQELVSRTDISVGADATVFGNAEIARRKDPSVKVVITVNSTYLLESIQVGDTCSLLNIPQGADDLIPSVMRIKRVEYDGLTATLHIAEVTDNFGREFGKAIE